MSIRQKSEGGEEKMAVTYKKLTERIDRAEEAKSVAQINSLQEKFWIGYAQACRDIRNDINSK